MDCCKFWHYACIFIKCANLSPFEIGTYVYTVNYLTFPVNWILDLVEHMGVIKIKKIKWILSTCMAKMKMHGHRIIFKIIFNENLECLELYSNSFVRSLLGAARKGTFLI